MSSGFVTETELAEARQRRQEEWEKVRTAEQPAECPEEPYDGRSLYDRLKEQKMKKDMEFEETHKLKNLIRGLDDDEVQFLELVDKSKMNAEKQQMREEENELKEFRERVATLQEEIVDKKIQTEIKNNQKAKSANATQRPSQKSLLGVGIKRKNGDDASSSAKVSKGGENGLDAEAAGAGDPTIHTTALDKGLLKCAAILPGIGPYTESSDSELSTGSDDEPEVSGQYDLVGRKRQKKKPCQEE